MELLVNLSDNKREVAFSGSSLDDLKVAIKEKFADVIKEGDEISKLQIWKEKFSSYVDLTPEDFDKIIDGCELNVVPEKCEPLPKQPHPNADIESSDFEPAGSNDHGELVPYCTDPVYERDDDVNLDGQPAEGPGAFAQPTKMWGGRDALSVHFLNPEVLGDGKYPLSIKTILAWAETWSSNLVPAIPAFRKTDLNDNADIRVLFGGGRCWSKVGTDAKLVTDKTKPTMNLSLKNHIPDFQKHLVIHEFGHSLGLEHEHQRSDFWNMASGLIDKNKMKADPRMATVNFDVDILAISARGDTTSYDPDSIMHYWFDPDWLVNIKHIQLTSAQDEFLKVIRKRNKTPATKPSEKDLNFLNEQYGNLCESRQTGIRRDSQIDIEKLTVQNEERGAPMGQMPPDGGKREETTEVTVPVSEVTQGRLVDMLKDFNDPIKFGSKLNIEQSNLDEIEKTFNDIDRQKLELFGYIERNTRTLGITWERIADVVMEMGHGNLSVKIRETYYQGAQGP